MNRPLLLLTAALAALALAQNSADQAKRGQTLVAQQCAACHGARLEGRYGPPLAGPRFLSKWGGSTAEELRAYIAARMPLGRAGTLSQGQTLDLVAYILQTNGYENGEAELKPESLSKIKLVRP